MQTKRHVSRVTLLKFRVVHASDDLKVAGSRKLQDGYLPRLNNGVTAASLDRPACFGPVLQSAVFSSFSFHRPHYLSCGSADPGAADSAAAAAAAATGRTNRVRRVELLVVTTSDVSIAGNNAVFYDQTRRGVALWSVLCPSSRSPAEPADVKATR